MTDIENHGRRDSQNSSAKREVVQTVRVNILGRAMMDLSRSFWEEIRCADQLTGALFSTGEK